MHNFRIYSKPSCFQAEYLLSHTDHSIKQIAESVGYTHTSHFADLFRRTTVYCQLNIGKWLKRMI